MASLIGAESVMISERVKPSSTTKVRPASSGSRIRITDRDTDGSGAKGSLPFNGDRHGFTALDDEALSEVRPVEQVAEAYAVLRR